MAGQEPPSKKKRKKGVIDSQLPNTEMLSDLKEAENLYKSNLFKLQLNELLQEISVPSTQQKKLEEYLHGLKLVLDGFEHKELETLSGGFALRNFPDIDIQLPPLLDAIPKKGRPLKINFKKPEKVEVVGSFLLKTLCRPALNIDITFEIPDLDEKDFNDFIYFEKRAVYLRAVYDELKVHPAYSNVKVAHFRGDVLKPILVITPPQEREGKLTNFRQYTIRLIPSIPEGVFPLKKLAPNRTAIRGTVPVGESKNEKLPTPFYNQAILEDMYYFSHLQQLHSLLTDCPSLGQAIILFKLWLKQHGLDDSNPDSDEQYFNGFLFSMLLAYLMLEKKIFKHMSSYQIFRAGLQFLAQHDWAKQPIVMPKLPGAGSDEKADRTEIKSTLELHGRAFDIVFLDSSRHLNLTYRISSIHYEELKHTAILSYKILEDPLRDGFNYLFMTATPFYTRFDSYISFSLEIPHNLSTTDSKFFLPKFPSLPPISAIQRRLYSLILQGFTDRIKMVSFNVRASKKTDNGRIWFFNIGLMHNETEIYRLLDIGPSAEDKPLSAKFRKFWGEKSQLRRFLDGRICESVQWEVLPSHVNEVPVLILRHIAKTHLQLPEDAVVDVGSQLTEILKPQASGATDFNEAYSLIRKAFHDLTEKLKKLPNFPLSVLSVSPSHPVFYSADPFPPTPREFSELDPHNIQDAIPVINFVLQLESSSKWPDDLMAIARIKSAFYIKIGESLRSTYQVTTNIGMDFVDIWYQYFPFRLRIYHDREILVLKDDLKQGNSLPKLPGIDYTSMEAEVVFRPQLVSVLGGLDKRYSLFGPTCRLARRWLSAHMFTSYVPFEVADLLCAYVFINHYPYSRPGSPFVGFQRFLWLLALHNWQEEPLILDFTEDMTLEQYNSVMAKFHEGRSAKTAPLMYIGSLQDPGSQMWTKSITKPIMERLVSYARNSYEYLMSILPRGKAFRNPKHWMTIFKTPLESFDVLIHLKEDALPAAIRKQWHFTKKSEKELEDDKKSTKERNQRRLKTQKELKAKKEIQEFPMLAFNPAECYLEDLAERFENFANFYYDSMGGDVIAVKWKEDMLKPVKFSLYRASYASPILDKDGNISQVALNIPELLEDFKRLGEGIVDNVVDVGELKKQESKKQENKQDYKKQDNKKQDNKKQDNKKQDNKKQDNKKQENKKQENKKQENKKQDNKKQDNKKQDNKKQENEEQDNKKQNNKKQNNKKQNQNQAKQGKKRKR